MARRPTSRHALGARLHSLRGQLSRSLFAPGPTRAVGIGRREGAVLLFALLALAVVLQLLRVGIGEALDSLWAEDGQVFLQGAISQDLWHNVFSPYAGYLVLVPRLIGEIGGAVPLGEAPAAIAVASAAVVALCGFVVWVCSAAHIRNPYLRGALAGLTVLSPVANLESIAAGAYVLWYMLFATFWLLLWRPATTRGAVLGALFALATGLSTPGVWFFLPLAILRAVAARDRRDVLILGGFGLGVVAQAPVLALNDEATVTPEWTSEIWTAYVQRVVDGAALGERLGGVAWEQLGWPFLIALLACLAVGLAFGAWRSSASARYLAAIAIPTSLAMFAVAVYQRAVGAQIVWTEGAHMGNGGRYAIVPALLLVSVALALIDQSTRGRSRAPWAVAATVAMLLLGAASSFYVRDPVARGAPAWEEALASAAASCEAEDLDTARVPTSPPGFGIVVPCDRLSSFSDAPAAR